jgi:hypothetical protein
MESFRESLLAEPIALSSELEELGQRLQDRASIRHLARAYVMVLVGIITFGIATRLLVDSTRVPFFFWPVAAIFLGCFAVGTRSALLGRRLLVQERDEFRRYRALRAEAGLE